MAHPLPSKSPAGTPLEDCTVGELVAEHPGMSRVFQAHGIDFCCQGGRTLRDACARTNRPLETVAADLRQLLATPAPTGLNPADLPPAELMTHIVDRHHGYLRQEMPRLYEMAQRVARRHGGHTPSLIEVFHVFTTLATELQGHVQQEEQTVFPALASRFASGTRPAPLDTQIEALIREHSDAGECLTRLRELTSGFVPPPDACNTYRALFAGLAELEADLHTHIHLENSVLFPAALRN